jgi:hypothetical protein
MCLRGRKSRLSSVRPPASALGLHTTQRICRTTDSGFELHDIIDDAVSVALNEGGQTDRPL